MVQARLRYLVSAGTEEMISAVLEGATRRLGRRVSHLRDLGKESVLALAPEEQYLVATGRTYFRDLSFDDLRRMQFDLETTGLNPDRDRIFMIAVRYPSGETDTLEAPCDGNAGEAALIRELVAKVTASRSGRNRKSQSPRVRPAVSREARANPWRAACARADRAAGLAGPRSQAGPDGGFGRAGAYGMSLPGAN